MVKAFAVVLIILGSLVGEEPKGVFIPYYLNETDYDYGLDLFDSLYAITEENELFKMKKHSFELLTLEEGLFTINFKDEIQPLLILTPNISLSSKNAFIKRFNESNPLNGAKEYENKLGTFTLVVEIIDSIPNNENSNVGAVSFITGNKKQVLSTYTHPNSTGVIPQWYGDFDGDGKIDLIYLHTGYCWETLFVYFSSYAENDELLGLVYEATFGS